MQPELAETLAKDTPAMHDTQTLAAACDEKPTAQGVHAGSPELAKVPAAQAVHVSELPLVDCA